MINLVFTLTNHEGQRLTACMLAMRPDWAKNNPGQILAEANATGLPGQDFGHALRALAAYCTARDENGWQYRTPNLYTQDGKYWATTAPADWTRPKAPACQDHPESEAPTCRGCHADVKCGDRPAHMIGKHWEQPTGMYELLKNSIPESLKPVKNETITVTSAVGATTPPNPEPPATAPPASTATECHLSRVGTGNVGSDAP